MGWFGLDKKEAEYLGSFMLGDKVDITLEGVIRDTYASSVQEVNASGIYLRSPRLGSSVLDEEPGTKVSVNVFTENGVFSFKTKIAGYERSRGIFILQRPTAVERIQRRQFFRLSIILMVKYAIFPEGEKNLAAPLPLIYQCYSKNISEGGALLLIDKIITPGALMKISVELQSGLNFDVIAKVLEQKKMDFDTKLSTRVQFVRVHDAERDKIRKYVLLHQNRKSIRSTVSGR